MKYILQCLIVFTSIQFCVAQQARIEYIFPRFDDKIDAARFACNEADRAAGVGITEMEFLNKNTLQITNHTPSPALGGIAIKILLDSNLNVIKVEYNEWADVYNGYTRTYTVESPAVLLNFNPFEKGTTTGLQGRFNFIIRIDYTPNERLQNQGEEPSTDFRMFYGRFKC